MSHLRQAALEEALRSGRSLPWMHGFKSHLRQKIIYSQISEPLINKICVG